MARDSFLDSRTKIPFFGIVAMVLIVAIVAVSLRTQVAGLFPESTVTVRSSDAITGNVVGSGSASFYGQREIPLVHKTRLRASMHQYDEILIFIVDEDARTARVSSGNLETTVALSPRNDGSGLTATFEFAGKNRRIDVFAMTGRLLYSEPGTSALVPELKLSDVVSYDGSFEYKNVQYGISFVPSGEYIMISGRSTESKISLVRQGSSYAGTWFESKKGHPLKLNPGDRTVVLENMW
ncbi:hypothetical protein GOV11_01585 [Candidatus Woesearchaeota archaeon]|nr:hypothetical protein [Candidatus Woesearchaeota archaeon]